MADSYFSKGRGRYPFFGVMPSDKKSSPNTTSPIETISGNIGYQEHTLSYFG